MEAPFLELKVQQMVKTMMQQNYPCIDQIIKDHESMKQSMQILRKRVQDLEKELMEVKTVQHRKYRKSLHEWLKTMRPKMSWKEWTQKWVEDMTMESLERIFLAHSFLESFLYELKKLRPTAISMQNPLPDELCPVVCFQEGMKRNLYIWDHEKEEWKIFDYSYLRKIIALYIFRIREWWMQWQEIHSNQLKDGDVCDKFNSYISKPVSVLYKESHKYKMFQLLKS